MTTSAWLLVAWAGALWANLWAAHPIDGTAAAVFGVLGFVLGAVVLVAIADAPSQRTARFLATLVVGPLLGYLVGSGAIVSLGPGDAVARMAIRALAAIALPLVACVVYVRGERRAAVAGFALVAFASLSGAAAVRDVATGVVRRDANVIGATFAEGDWVASLDGVSVHIDPRRHALRIGDRGRAAYLPGSGELLEWNATATSELPGGAHRDAQGRGVPGPAGLVVLLVFATIVCVTSVARRSPWPVVLGLAVILATSLDFILVSAFGRRVEAIVVDKGWVATRSARRSGFERWYYRYAIRARADRDALADDVDEDTFHRLDIGDRVSFVAVPWRSRAQALGEPHLGFGAVTALGAAAIVGLIALSKRS